MSWKKVLLEGDAAVLSDTVAGTIGENDTASAGVATQASRQDHVHGSPATWAPTAHEASHKDGGSDEILLHEFGAPTAAVDFNKQQATSLALDVQGSDPATPVDGQIYFSSADDHPYIYVAA